MTSSETAELKYTGSLELKDGMIHMIHDAGLPSHYGGYHPKTSTVFYGGPLEMPDPLTIRIGQRDIRIQNGERAEVISKVAEQCDAWHTMTDDHEAFVEEIKGLMTQTHTLNPDMLSMIGTEAAQKYASPSSGSQRPPGIPVRLQLAEGVGLRSIPKSGWTLQADGSITDNDGNLLYHKATTPSQAGRPITTSTGSERPPPPPAPRGGVLGSLRRLFGGGQ